VDNPVLLTDQLVTELVLVPKEGKTKKFLALKNAFLRLIICQNAFFQNKEKLVVEKNWK